MELQDTFIWALTTMQKGELPAHYAQQQGDGSLIYLDWAAHELGINDIGLLKQQLLEIGFLADAQPIRKEVYLGLNGIMYRRNDKHQCISVKRVYVDMYCVTSLIKLRKLFGKVDPDNWPKYWQEWRTVAEMYLEEGVRHA